MGVTAAAVEALLEEARRRTLDLLDPLADEQLTRQHSPLMSPLVWDLAHIANYEEQWLLRALGGAPYRPELDDLYDAFAHPRRTRSALPILGPAEARAYGSEVRSRVLDLLAGIDFGDDDRLRRDGFVYGMVVQHEHQHDETLLAAVQLLPEGYRPAASAAPEALVTLGGDVLVDAGKVVIGAGDEPWAYDNERPAHTVDLAPFRIDVAPVTNAAYAEFVAAGGYDDHRLWSDAGWRWRQEAGLVAPQFWEPDGAGGWTRDRFGHVEALPASEPVQHVCWYEADAFARWAGRRLPTEYEWEAAATSTPSGATRRWPWGDDPPSAACANLGQHRFGPDPVGSHPDGASGWGVHHLIGDVWEWTASDFLPWPGFEPFPYREYSDVFWGAEYKTLKGGSWAVHPTAVRPSFRNWDLPIRRQIFAGFRTAKDA